MTMDLNRWLSMGAMLFVALCLALPGTSFAQDGERSGKMGKPAAETQTETPADDGRSGKMGKKAADGEEEEAPKEEGDGTAEAVEATAATEAEDGATYDMRVRELEEKVNDLKEKIFRSKSRLVLLKETVLRGSISGSKSVLIHRNEMGNSFRLEQAIYSLDGNQIYNKIDQEGDLADKEQFEIFNGAIVPGNHNISVMLVYRGNGFGVFSYLQGYKFTIRSSYTFTAEEGKATQVKIIGHEKGGVTTALEDRPDVRYELEFVDDVDDAPRAAAK